MSYTWHSFLWTADEWLIAYASPPSNLMGVKLFAIGHALELYLKAAYAKRFDSVEDAIAYGHKLGALWSALKSADQSFLPAWTISASILAAMPVKDQGRGIFTPEEYRHFLAHEEIYHVMHRLVNWKYVGLPDLDGSRPTSFGFVHPSGQWLRLFKDLRAYLGHPDGTHTDIIQLHLEDGSLAPESAAYLAELYA